MRRWLAIGGAVLGLTALSLALTLNNMRVALPFLLVGLGCFGWVAIDRRGGLGNAWNGLLAAIYVISILGSMLGFFGLSLPRLPEKDLTGRGLNTLTQLSRVWIGRLEQPVQLTVFTYERENWVRFLERFREANPDKISYQVFDPQADSAKASQFPPPVLPEDIFVQVGERLERANGLEEGTVVNAMVAATSDGPRTVYFLTGHGELLLARAPEENPAMKELAIGAFVDVLEERRFQVAGMSLLEMKSVGGELPEIPADAALLVAMGGTTRLKPDEVAALKEYLERGGKLVLGLGHNKDVVANSNAETLFPGWAEVAETMGIALEDGVILDIAGGQMFDDFTRAVPRFRMGLEPFAGDQSEPAQIAFEASRHIRPADIPPPETLAETVMYSSEYSFVRDPDELRRKAGQVKPTEKELAPQPLAVRSTRVFANEEGSAEGRMVVFASAAPFSDANLNQPSARVLLQAVEQLVADAKSESQLPIPSQTLPDQSLVLDPEKMKFLFILHILFLPGVVFFAGMGMTLARREERIE